MAQGKLKVKSKVPDNIAKKKKQQAQLKKVAKAAQSKVSKKSKNQKIQVSAKLHKEVQKKINSNIESELAVVASRVEEGKQFKTIGSEIGQKKK